jgi:hypothetical protein
MKFGIEVVQTETPGIQLMKLSSKNDNFIILNEISLLFEVIFGTN